MREISAGTGADR